MGVYVQTKCMAMPREYFCFCIGYSMWSHYVCCGHWHNHFLQLGKAVWASAQSIFPIQFRWLCLPPIYNYFIYICFYSSSSCHCHVRCQCYKTLFFVTDNCSRNKLVFVLDNNYQAPIIEATRRRTNKQTKQKKWSGLNNPAYFEPIPL